MRQPACAFLAFVLVLAACSRSPAAAPASHIGDAAGVGDEYQAEIARLEFPEGYEPAARPPGVRDDERYETGFGISTADFQWLCAWFDEHMTYRVTDEARSTHALDVLAKFPSLALWDHMDSAGRETILTAVEAARDGDSTGIESQQTAMMCTD